MSVDPCESRLTVHLSCNNLRNMDFIGRSDPFALLFLDNTGTTAPRRRALPPPPSVAATDPTAAAVPPAPPGSVPVDDPPPLSGSSSTARPATQGRHAYAPRDAPWERYGATETVPNELNPSFATSFEIPYFFERSQRLAIDVFDRDAAPTADVYQHLHRHDYLGSAEIAVPHIVRARGQRFSVPLKLPAHPNARCGTLTIVVEELSAIRQCLRYDVAVERMPRPRLFAPRRRKPCLTVLRRAASATGPGTGGGGAAGQRAVARAQQQGASWITVLQTAPATEASGGRYIVPDFSASYEKLCRCDDATPLRFELSFERHGKHRVVASVEKSLSAIDAAGGRLELFAKKPPGAAAKRAKPDALVSMRNRSLWQDPSFLDYIVGGCEISLVIGIDFTASNGDPSKRGTRHFVDQMQSNEYELAIREVGDILAAYDTDQLIPAYGFGARLPPDFEETSHLFPLNMSDEPHCYAIDEVLNNYRQSLYTVRLSGPTHFAPMVRRATEHCRAESGSHDQSYTILLIITDGVISDLDATLAELNRASSLPFSVVIIGVGDEDFSDMIELDGDFKQLERDIVQFVEFRRYQNSPEVLRSRVLEEIPRQFLQYMQGRRIAPRPPPTAEG